MRMTLLRIGASALLLGTFVLGWTEDASARTVTQWISYEPCSTGRGLLSVTYDDDGNFVGSNLTCEEYVV